MFNLDVRIQLLYFGYHCINRACIVFVFSITAWCLRSEGVSSVLLGVSNTDQLLENLGALRVKKQNKR